MRASRRPVVEETHDPGRRLAAYLRRAPDRGPTRPQPSAPWRVVCWGSTPSPRQKNSFPARSCFRRAIIAGTSLAPSVRRRYLADLAAGPPKAPTFVHSYDIHDDEGPGPKNAVLAQRLDDDLPCRLAGLLTAGAAGVPPDRAKLLRAIMADRARKGLAWVGPRLFRDEHKDELSRG
jgi:hypothetical protein